MGPRQQWSLTNPQDAARWVNGFPAGNLRNETVPELVGNWTKTDPQSAEQFLATLPDDAARQTSIHRYVDNIYRDNPIAAANWAVELADENRRNVYIEKIANMWRRSDATAMRERIITTPLPADRQQKYLGE